ncbi:hypothetical protein M426DRAFT_175000 [Hypoxylon sp. CI-4A]|nr:hypothetical protein M426DRAFT_175000 [Hypoxylon sp. CI-4A]
MSLCVDEDLAFFSVLVTYYFFISLLFLVTSSWIPPSRGHLLLHLGPLLISWWLLNLLHREQCSLVGFGRLSWI